MKAVKNDKGEIIGIVIDDFFFSPEDIYACPVLHKVYHKMLEDDERDTDKEDN